MLLASISAMWGCACSLSRICRWNLTFSLNLFLRNARSGFEYAESFAIVLCICMESSFLDESDPASRFAGHGQNYTLPDASVVEKLD